MKNHVGYGSLYLGMLALVMATLLLIPRPAAAVDFGQDVLITSNNYRQEYPAALVAANGYILVIWQDDRNNAGSSSDILFGRSTDNGSSFSSPVRVDDSSSNTDQIYPQLAVDSKGKLHAVWSDFRGGSYYRIYYANSTDNGSSWSANVQVNYTATGAQTTPAIAVDSSDNIYVVWDDGRSGYHIYMAKSTNGGTSFTAATKVDSSSGYARYPWVCAASNGNLTVAWQDSRNTNWDVFLATSTNGGTSFGSDVNVTKDTSSSSQMYPRVAAESGGNLHVVWADNRFGNFGVFYGTSGDGSSFNAVPVNDTDTGIASGVASSIAVDTGGVVHVAWQDKRSGSGYYRIYYSESTGASTFSTSVRVDNTTTANCNHPVVFTDSNNVPSVVWDDDRNTNLDIFYDRTQNAPPFAPEPLTPAADTWVTSGKPSFSWNFKDANSSDTQGAFQLQVAKAASFSPTDYDSGVVVSSTSSHTASSTIADGNYYWRARTRDKGGVWGPYSSGRVVKIDTAAPSAAAPSDAGTWSTPSTLNFSWTPSSDSGSGVAGYYFCLGTSAGATDILSDQWTAVPAYTCSGGTNGTTYYAKVKAQDNATNAGSYGSNSDGITVDVTVPAAGTPADSGRYTNSSLVKFSWAASDDFPSGIEGYYISIGSGPGLDDLVKDYLTSSNAYTYAGGLNGVTYYAKVKARDNAGNVGGFGGNSDGITVDTSVPTSYTPLDNGTYSNTSTLYWFWPPSWDSPSGITGYYISIGTSYGENDTVADSFTTATSFTLSGASDGATYYCRVFAVDQAGNSGPFSASSDGITVDTSPPADLAIDDDGDYTRGNTTLHAIWTSSLDDISGVAEYQFAIGSNPGTTDVLGWTTAGTGTSMNRKNLSLQNGVIYFVSARARNGAGLWSGVATTDGITVDMTIPTAGTPTTPGGSFATSTSITWNWTPSEDIPSGIRGYYICIGTTPGGSEVVRDGFTADYYYTFPSALNGRTYYARVKAADAAGNVGPYGGGSVGVLVDISIPEVATPLDEGQYSTRTTLVFSWDAVADLPSGILTYTISIGTTPGGSDVLRDQNTTATSYTLADAVPGRTYYAKARATDNAGNAGAYSAPSDGILVDLTPPGAVAVYGGGFQQNDNALSLSWSLSIDPETPVVEYLYAVGTTAGGAELMDWRTAGLRVSLTLDGLSLASGRNYYPSVRARNAAGLLGNISVGEPIMVDAVAPVSPVPRPPGPFTNRTIVYWVWNASADAESGIFGYLVYIGTTPDGSDVLDGGWATGTSFSFLGGLNGVTYYARLSARDRAGNIGPPSASAEGVTVDTSLPSAYPPAAPSAYTMFTNITWSWTPSSDSPSGIQGYLVSIGSFTGGEDLVSDYWTAVTSYRFGGGQDGRAYYIKVRARDNAGNLGDWVTGTVGVAVDLSPPAGAIVIEGGAPATSKTSVILGLTSSSDDTAEMMIGSDPGLTGGSWEPFARLRSWLLNGTDGPKTVYVQFRDRAGQVSDVYSATISLDTAVAPFKLASSAGTTTRDGETTISSRVEPLSRVFVNGEQVTLAPDGSFSRGVALQEGSNVITVTVIDPAGNTQTLTKSIWRTPSSGVLPGGADSTLFLLLFVLLLVMIIAVLGVSLMTRGLVKSHLGGHQQEPVTPVRKRPRQPAAMAGTTVGEEPSAGAGEAPPEPARPVPSREPWPTEEAPSQARPEAPALEMPLSETTQPVYQVQSEQWAPQPAAPQPAPFVQPSEGDVIIRADGTEAPAEPRLISEWSPATGQWQPVAEEQPREQPAPAEQYQPPPEEGPAMMAPEPGRALEDLARSARPKEERAARPESAPQAPLPTAPAQRLSAKQIYAALYGKKGGPPGPGAAPGTAPAPPTAASPALPIQPAPSPPAEGKQVLGRARCANCKGIIPIFSAERPLRIRCASCGQEGMIK